MENIELINPSHLYKEQIMEYKNEFLLHSDSLDGTAGLKTAQNFEEWLSAIQDNASEETVRTGLVPASTYLAVRTADSRIVGMIDIRRRLNDYLLQFGGNIGYSVRKSERQKGYASEILRLALRKCRIMNMDRVLITCDKDNIGSAKTILKNGGILENEVEEQHGITQRYWINLA